MLRVADAVCTAAPIAPSNSLLNRVNGLADADDDELAEIDAFYGANGVAQYVVAPQCPSSPTACTPAASSFATVDDVPARRRGAAAVREIPPYRSRRRAATSSQRSSAPCPGCRRTSRRCSRRSPAATAGTAWSRATATEAVACGALFVHEGAGWLGAAGTLPAHRGKGAQGALLAARIALAQELGLDVLTTETGERRNDESDISYRNILRAGFEEAYLRPNLVSPGS